jgi:hypothetical protein
MVMWSSRVRTARVIVAVAACSVVCALPSATAAPSTDQQGYVDSAARCSAPNTAVLFGSTDSSRVAVCKTTAGQFEYRGVRLRDGAKLVLPASQSGGGYVADNDGISYAVTAHSLVISQGSNVIREEPMVDSHQPNAPASPGAGPQSATTTPTTPLPPPLPAEVGGSH